MLTLTHDLCGNNTFNLSYIIYTDLKLNANKNDYQLCFCFLSGRVPLMKSKGAFLLPLRLF